MSGWDAITEEAAADSPLWAAMVKPLPDQDREAVFSTLAKESLATAVETIYEAYLVHLGRSRLFSPRDANGALLLGDHLYARGLARLQEVAEPQVMAGCSELISIVARLLGDGRHDDGFVWAATAAAGSHRDLAAAQELFTNTGDSSALGTLVLCEVDRDACDRALAAHRARVTGASAGATALRS
jgi:hypothetical protein